MTNAVFQTMHEMLVEQKWEPLTVDDMMAIVAGQIRHLAPMNGEIANLLQQLAKRLIEQVGKENRRLEW